MLSFSSPIRSTRSLPVARTNSDQHQPQHSHLHLHSHPLPRGAHLLLNGTPNEILRNLWLSGLYTAVDEDQLIALGVTHIVSVIEQRPAYPHTLQKLKTLHIPLQDRDGADILQHFDTTTAFIKSALEHKGNVVLVHCAMGISRSATIVCAYLMATLRMSPHEALEYVQQRRKIVCPNLSFRRQLDAYAVRLRSRGYGPGPAAAVRKLRKALPPPPVAVTVRPRRWRWSRDDALPLSAGMRPGYLPSSRRG